MVAVSHVYWPKEGLSDEDSAYFCRAFHWAGYVDAGSTRIRDEDLARMACMRRLKGMDLSETGITGAGLGELAL